MTTLAKEVHGRVAPATAYQGLMPGSSVSIWIMEVLPGVGYLFIYSSITRTKMDHTVTDLAK